MLPFKSIIHIDRSSRTPVYLQIVNALIREVKQGRLLAGAKLPGSRQLAELLQVHRKTVVTAYDELLAQGWIEIIPAKGTFIHQNIPKKRYKPISEKEQGIPKVALETGYKLFPQPALVFPEGSDPRLLHLDDGFPDIRLAPLQALAREYRNVTRAKNWRRYFHYGSPLGDEHLREQLASYLMTTRGIHISMDNIIVTRGSIMGIYLLTQTILKPADKVIVGNTNYGTANRMISHVGAQLLRVPVDQYGLDVEKIEELCQQHPIRAIYVASHHHHPTTVTLSAERRVKLLDLAKIHRFAILEDDYDYDFHYASSPILPLASADEEGMVAYIGSISKSIAPAFRIGFVVGPKNLVSELAKLRRIVDRQGDLVLEKAVAILFEDGEVRRHLRKAIHIYRERRDHLCQLLATSLRDGVQFSKPEGGLAIWTRFDPKINLPILAERAEKAGLYFGNGLSYNPPNQQLNATRLGFGSSNFEELERAVHILQSCID
ncbi:MAG: PLP-dependent aminotransferase family protein [Flammeovirgaceae bacterium]